MNRKRWLASVTLGVMMVSTALPAAAQIQDLQPETPAPIYFSDEMVDETPRSWFVELEGAPAVEGGSAATLKNGRANFRSNAAKQKIKFKERMEFDSLFNGFSIEADPSQLGAIRRLPGVKAIYPVIPMARPEVQEGGEPDLYTALDMTGASVVQSELGYTGQGIKVAIMDTGIDYDHPDLGGGFGRGYRVAYGYDFVGDDYNADSDSPSYNPIPSPDPFPDDCEGHGTHVAGIVGANGTVKGVAPDVTFGAYRVFGCEGSTTADIMLAAMEMAWKDKMDVLNMSIGSSFQWPEYPTAVAASRLAQKGMVVVASIGNSGANGLYAAGAPGVGEKVIGVASFENTDIFLNQFTVSPDDMNVGYVNASAAPVAPVDGTYDLARTGDQTTVDDACAALPAGSLDGQIALIRRGTCGFYNKALHAQRAGAVGVVLYNNAPGAVNPTVAPVAPDTEVITIPVVMISQAQGDEIDSRLAEGPVSMTWTDTKGSYPNALAGTIASTSSYGLAADLSLKPDIGAPGANIYSTYPLEQEGYATLSGTSMSSPHVAGAAALFLEANPRTRPEDVRAIFQSTAEPMNWWGNPALGLLDSTNRQGAGMLQIDKAILAGIQIEEGKISLGEMTSDRPSSHTLTVRNNSGRRITYALSHEEAVSTGNTYSPSFSIWDDTVTFKDDTVTLSPRGVTKIRVSIAPDAEMPDGTIFGGYLVLTPVNGDGPVLRVPYAGYKGDYQEKVALAPTTFGFPWLGHREGDSLFKDLEGTIYSMVDGDLPHVILHLDHQVSRLRIGVKPANGTQVAYFYDEEHVGRNSTPTGVFAYAFDGITLNGKKEVVAPDGDYTFVVEVLKALGNPKDPSHWETWESPFFTIDRP